jgi:hypothetical protein
MLLMLGGFVLWQVLPSLWLPYSCSPWGQHALTSAEGYVRDQFGDATSLQVQTYDCDSGDSAFLQFQTALGPAAARDVLLRDPTCHRVDQDEPDGELVECGSKRRPKVLFLESWRAGTRGELYLDSR